MKYQQLLYISNMNVMIFILDVIIRRCMVPRSHTPADTNAMIFVYII